MEDSRIAIPGGWYATESYELRYERKGDPYCHTGFPCDRDGNLIMANADVWGGEYLLVKDSEFWEFKGIKKLVRKIKGRSLIACDCGEKFLDMPDGRGNIICPRCGQEYDNEGRPVTSKPEPSRNGFHVVKKGECA